MSKKEQNALMAFLNSFRLTKRVTAFEQLSDGRALMEVMSNIDATHFKNTVARGSPSSSSSNENWVLKMNTLKRLYRLLLSFPLPSPHPSLSLTSLPEPSFTVIARSPTTAEGAAGIVQICRFCLSVAVWAPGNEKVITKIQSLGEVHMAELMSGIEEVMSTLPTAEEGGSVQSSPEKARPVSPPIASRAERDKLLQENDELRARCEMMITQVAEMTRSLEEAKEEKDEALHRLNSRLETSASGLRTSQTATSEIDSLRADLAKAEENYTQAEVDLHKSRDTVAELTTSVEVYKAKAADASRLKDQLDEHRHTAERLQKSENVIEKYKKKLDESAGLRRELRNLEEENSALINTNARLEVALKQAGSSHVLLDSYKTQIEVLERKSDEQAAKISELSVQLETTTAEMAELEQAYERDVEDLHLLQDRVKEMDLGASPSLLRSESKGALFNSAGNTSLGEEIGNVDEGDGPGETKTTLKLKIRALQRELAEAKSTSSEGQRVQVLESLLADANKARDKYQSEYLDAHRNGLSLQANLEHIRSLKGGDSSQTAAALRQRLHKVVEERDTLLKAKEEALFIREELQKELADARIDLSLIDQDEKARLAKLRETIAGEAEDLAKTVADLKDEISALKEKDALHLEEIKRLLMDKVDLQSSGIDQREQALKREKEFSDLRASLSKSGVSPEAQQQMVDLHSRNEDLNTEVASLSDKLQKAKDFIRDQDALFRANHANQTRGDLGEAQKSYEDQIASLREEVQKAKQNTVALEKRYKLEQQLMLSAWHELGSRTVRDHIGAAGARRTVQRPVATSWLGRQRRYQEEASFSR